VLVDEGVLVHEWVLVHAHDILFGHGILFGGLVQAELVHVLEVVPGRGQYYMIYVLCHGRGCIPAVGNPSPWTGFHRRNVQSKYSTHST